MSTRMRQLCYNSLMLIVATASFAAFGGIDSIIEHTVVVSPNKAKNKAFRMEAGSAVCDLYLTPESPWAIRDSRITGRDDKTLWKKIDKAHYFMVYGYAVNEYVKIDGDLYKSGTGTGGAGTPEYPPFSVTVPKVDLQWGEKHGDASKEEKEDAVPALLVVSNEGSDFGELIVKAPKDDFSMPSIKPKVTLTWDRGNAVRVFDGESEVKSGVTFMLMWGTEKHLSVRAVAPADKVKFMLEGEPDIVNGDKAADYVNACCGQCEFIAYVDQPVPKTRTVFSPPKNVGHAFWQFRTSIPIKFFGSKYHRYINKEMGLYPEECAITFEDVKGKLVIPDREHIAGGDVTKSWPISIDKFNAGLEFCRIHDEGIGKQTIKYNLVSYNCAWVTIEAALSCGVKIPRTFGKYPYLNGVEGPNPGDLGEDIRNMP